MCALCHHLLDSSLRDFSSRVAMSVCLRFLCACCRIAFTTTTNTTIANYSLMPSRSLPLSLSLLLFSFYLCLLWLIHSFIYLYYSANHTHTPRTFRALFLLLQLNPQLDSAFLSVSLYLCLILLTWLLLGVVVASRFYSFCAHAIH